MVLLNRIYTCCYLNIMSFIRIYSFFLFLFFVQNQCFDFDKTAGQKNRNTQIRVINNSCQNVTRVSLFSMMFDDLKPNDTSEYKELDYNSLQDDPLIYCVSNGESFGRYLKVPKREVKQYTYVIDSLRNRIIYVSSHADQ